MSSQLGNNSWGWSFWGSFNGIAEADVCYKYLTLVWLSLKSAGWAEIYGSLFIFSSSITIITVMVSHGGIKESSKARAGLDGALVDTFS